ncbi:MAG: hypothetical protein ABI630_01905 [Betaproteobacteria bacterium]
MIVVSASRATERLGPFLGSMIATLPVSTGPIYVFLAIDHGPQFISDSARMGVIAVVATVAFVAVHAVVAQRHATFVSWLCATAAWFLVASLLQLREWSFVEGCLVFAACFALAIRSLRRYVVEIKAPPMPRVRFDLALRSALVAGVVVATTIAGNAVGPAATGTLATYPVVFTSLVLILQPRCGGPFTAALLVNSLKGLIGFGTALGVLHLAAARLGSTAGLLLGLAVAIAWNVGLFLLRHRR